MKYMAIIDVDEKPVSCEFIGCNGNTAPYLIGATTSIKVLEQEPILDRIRAEIEEIETYDGLYIDRAYVLQIIDKYKEEREK